VPSSDGKLIGEVCLITGGTGGIGRATAEALAVRGARVIIVGHTPEKGQRAQREIREATGNQEVAYMQADLAVMGEVRRLAERVLGEYERLDVLINNAGAYFWERQKTPEGYEMTWALDHLQYFVLTLLMLPRLEKSAPARVINVASNAHRRGSMAWDDLQGRERYDGRTAYNQAKLANVLFTYELARRLGGTDITANALTPGFVATDIGTTGQSPIRWLVKFAHLFGKSPVEGAQTSIYLAASPEVEGVTGGYFSEREPTLSSAASYDREAAQRLWEISEKMTGERWPMAATPAQGHVGT
jgi:NAD(P)-dependent dehydrogenase (short-subunit alcohol dehydrogenase family)